MLDASDLQLLEEMQSAVLAWRSGDMSVGRLADRLLEFSDVLLFRDLEWEHAVTQHILTLDSASTFVPANDEESRQALAATTAATEGLVELIGQKVGSMPSSKIPKIS